MFRNVFGKNTTSALLNLLSTRLLHSPAPTTQPLVEALSPAYKIANTHAELHATYFHIRSLEKPIEEAKAAPGIFCEGAYANMLKVKTRQEAKADQLEKELKVLHNAHPAYRYK